MGVYVITGASSGIGAKTAEILRERGHEVVNIDLKDGDINANLATKEGRANALAELHERYPDGIDAMICNAGVSGGKVPISLIISLNYFGATEMARGAFDLACHRVATGCFCLRINKELNSLVNERMLACDLY